MNALNDEYLELLKLTRSYLLQEHSLSDRIFADSEAYNFFRDLARKNAAVTPKAIQPTHPTPIANALQPPYKPVISNTTPVSTTLLTNTPNQKGVPSNRVENEQPKFSEPKIINEITSNAVTSIAPVQKPSVPVIVNNEREVKIDSIFVPETSTSYEAVDVSEIRKIISEKHPSIRLIDTIPVDTEAKKRARNWEHEQSTQILILSFNDSPRYNNFLENVCFAIEVHGYNVRLVNGLDIERNKKWSSLLTSKVLQLVVAASGDIESSSELKKQFRENNQSAQYTLGGIPLVLLADPTIYMNEPHLKAVLWQNLKEHLKRSA